MGELGGERALRLAVPRERCPRAAHPAAPSRRADAALAAAPEGAGPAPGRAPVRLVPDHPRDVPRVPAGRLRPAGAEAAARPGSKTRQLDLVDVETAIGVALLDARCSSTTSRRTCTRTTRRRPSGARRRCRSTAICCEELLGQEELRELIDPGALDDVEAAAPRRSAQRRTSCTMCCGCAVTCGPDQYDSELAEPLLAERRAITLRIAGEERLVAAEDAGRYRDALGAMPPGGLPEAFLEGGAGFARERWSLRFAEGRGPFTTAEANEHFGIDVEPRAARARARGAARPRRAPAGRNRARVVRSGRPAPPATRVARRAPQGGRARRAGRARRVSCRAGTGSTGARASARRSCPLQALAAARSRSGRARCCRGACRTTSRRSSTSSARPARSSGSAPGSTGSPSTSARTLRRSAGPPRAEPPGGRRRTTGFARCSARGAEFWFDLLGATRARGRAGAAGPLGARLGGRGDERRLDAAAGRPPLRRAAPGAPAAPLLATPRRRDHGHAGPLVARPTVCSAMSRAGPDIRTARARRAAARAAGHRHARRRPRRGHRRRLRRRLRRAAGARDARPLPPRLLRRGARRSAVRARRRRRAAARAASSRGRGARARSCSPPPIPRSRTAPPCRGRSGPVPALPGSRAPTSCCSAARRRSSSSAAAARSFAALRAPVEALAAPGTGRRSSSAVRRGGERLAVERFDGEPVGRDGADAAPARSRLPRRSSPRPCCGLDRPPRFVGSGRRPGSPSPRREPHSRSCSGRNTPLPRRRPHVLAHQVATLDALSGGRVSSTGMRGESSSVRSVRRRTLERGQRC